MGLLRTFLLLPMLSFWLTACGEPTAVGPAESPRITTDSLPAARTDRDYRWQLEAQGGATPYSWSIALLGMYGQPPVDSFRRLPPGLSLSGDGLIIGRPTTGGRFTFDAKVTAADRRPDIQTLAIDVARVLAPHERCADHGPTAIPTFADPALALMIANGPLGPNITCQTASAVRGVYQAGVFSGVMSLLGLQNLTGLRDIWLNDNGPRDHAISDLSPIAGLTSLEELEFAGSQIVDVSPLEGLTALQRLTLANNTALVDIQPLLDNPGLGPLDRIDLRGTAVSCSDVSTLAAKGPIVQSDCP